MTSEKTGKDSPRTAPPPATPVFLMSWAALEAALSLLSSPDKAGQIPTVMSALRRLQPSVPPEKLLVQILSATAWLTADEHPLDGGPGEEASMT